MGRKVKDLRVGDRVFGAADPFKGGAFAERIAVPAAQVARLPSTLSPSDAAALPIAGLAALQSLRDLGGVATGRTVLIHGATGPVGLYGVQLAKLMGGRVTAVGGAGLETARRFGADVLIDYRNGQSIAKGDRFDVILNASGKMPFAISKAFLEPTGVLIEPSPTIPVFIGSKLGNLLRSRKHAVLATRVHRADLDELAKDGRRGRAEAGDRGDLPVRRRFAGLRIGRARRRRRKGRGDPMSKRFLAIGIASTGRSNPAAPARRLRPARRGMRRVAARRR